MIYIKYTESDFDDLKKMNRQQLEAELKDVYIRDLNYWMQQCDIREGRINVLIGRMERLIEYLGNKNLGVPRKVREKAKRIMEGLD